MFREKGAFGIGVDSLLFLFTRKKVFSIGGHEGCLETSSRKVILNSEKRRGGKKNLYDVLF